MKNRNLFCFVIVLSLLLVVGCNSTKVKNNEEKINNKTIEVSDKMKIIIDDKEYEVNLENNETVKELLKMLPLELKMDELNGNEKYIYLDKTLPTNSYNPKEIKSGDIMLYGNNCLVIFYKSFNTSYRYTKIGHIDDLPSLDGNSIIVKIK